MITPAVHLVPLICGTVTAAMLSCGRRVTQLLPGAYKDIDTVMENQSDLVEIVHTLKAVLCVKGN